jgi:hypothetical protein
MMANLLHTNTIYALRRYNHQHANLVATKMATPIKRDVV